MHTARSNEPSRGASPKGTRPGLLQHPKSAGLADGTVRVNPAKMAVLLDGTDQAGNKKTSEGVGIVHRGRGGSKLDRTW
jgi:hypothetical protein